MLENFKFTKPSHRDHYDLIKLANKQLTNLLHFFCIFMKLERVSGSGVTVMLKKSITEFNKKDSDDVFNFCKEIFEQIDYSNISKLNFNMYNKIEEQFHKKSMYEEYSELQKFFESNLNEERAKNSYNEKLLHLYGRLDHTNKDDGDAVYGLAKRFSTILINYPGNDVINSREYKEYDEIENIWDRTYNFYSFESVFSELLSKNSFRWIEENVANKNDIKRKSEDFKKSWDISNKTTIKINEIYNPFSEKVDWDKPEQTLEELKKIEIKIKALENYDKDYETIKIQEALKLIESLKDSLETISKTKNMQTKLELIPYFIFLFIPILLLIFLLL